MHQEIELAEPNFIPLSSEEAAEAIRLLAALIRAVRTRFPEPLIPPPEDLCSLEDLADGSPPAPEDRGKPGLPEGAGGEA